MPKILMNFILRKLLIWNLFIVYILPKFLLKVIFFAKKNHRNFDKNKKYLMVAYADLKGVATYVPMLTVGQQIH